jgi:hypothetical protein
VWGLALDLAGYGGHAVFDLIARFFVDVTTANSFPVVMGIYSAILGLFIPSGGRKWIIEARYVMQAANTLHVHLWLGRPDFPGGRSVAQSRQSVLDASDPRRPGTRRASPLSYKAFA